MPGLRPAVLRHSARRLWRRSATIDCVYTHTQGPAASTTSSPGKGRPPCRPFHFGPNELAGVEPALIGCRACAPQSRAIPRGDPRAAPRRSLACPPTRKAPPPPPPHPRERVGLRAGPFILGRMSLRESNPLSSAAGPAPRSLAPFRAATLAPPRDDPLRVHPHARPRRLHHLIPGKGSASVPALSFWAE